MLSGNAMYNILPSYHQHKTRIVTYAYDQSRPLSTFLASRVLLIGVRFALESIIRERGASELRSARSALLRRFSNDD